MKKSVFAFLSAAAGSALLTGCGDDGDINTITLTQPLIYDQAGDHDLLVKLVSTVWVNDGRSRAFYFVRIGDAYRTYIIDRQGPVTIRYKGRDDKQSDSDKPDADRDNNVDRTADFGAAVINIPQSLVPVEGGILSQVKVGKLTFVGFYPLTQVGQQTTYANKFDSAAMMAKLLPDIDSDKDVVAETFNGFLFDAPSEGLAMVLAKDATQLFADEIKNNDDVWNVSNLTAPQSPNDQSAVAEIRRYLQAE